jgi:ankyrin repeat protein
LISGLTALHGAAIGKKSDAIKRLLEAGADVTLEDKTGKTALDIAEQSKDAASIQLLREAADGQATEQTEQEAS